MFWGHRSAYPYTLHRSTSEWDISWTRVIYSPIFRWEQTHWHSLHFCWSMSNWWMAKRLQFCASSAFDAAIYCVQHSAWPRQNRARPRLRHSQTTYEYWMDVEVSLALIKMPFSDWRINKFDVYFSVIRSRRFRCEKPKFGQHKMKFEYHFARIRRKGQLKSSTRPFLL